MRDLNRHLKDVKACKANQVFAKRILVSYDNKVEAGMTHWEACCAISFMTDLVPGFIEACIYYAERS